MADKFVIKTFNNISRKGLDVFPDNRYQISDSVDVADAIVLRSAKLHDMAIDNQLTAVGRAGAGVNNVPVTRLTEAGIPVFNTPGANANAVKELVVAGMLLASRNICDAWHYTKNLQSSGEELSKQVELGKKQYVGTELVGKTLGVVGLGAIGVEAANAAIALGMNVIGYDPVLTVQSAWRIDTQVKKAQSLEEVLVAADFLTVHVPLNDETRNMINLQRLQLLPDHAVLLNFSREGIYDEEAIAKLLNTEKIHAYVTDFPHARFRDHAKVISLPHLGASTAQSEENCAVMIAQQLRDYLEYGHIRHSVNFPAIEMPWREGFRLAVVNRNIPNMVGQITTLLAQHGMNVIDLINRSRSDMAYTLIDVDQAVSDDLLQAIKAIEGVIRVRTIGG